MVPVNVSPPLPAGLLWRPLECLWLHHRHRQRGGCHPERSWCESFCWSWYDDNHSWYPDELKKQSYMSGLIWSMIWRWCDPHSWSVLAHRKGSVLVPTISTLGHPLHCPHRILAHSDNIIPHLLLINIYIGLHTAKTWRERHTSSFFSLSRCGSATSHTFTAHKHQLSSRFCPPSIHPPGSLVLSVLHRLPWPPVEDCTVSMAAL